MKKKETPYTSKSTKPISPLANTRVKMSHELAAGKYTQPRGASNSQAGARRQSKAVRHSTKK